MAKVKEMQNKKCDASGKTLSSNMQKLIDKANDKLKKLSNSDKEAQKTKGDRIQVFLSFILIGLGAFIADFEKSWPVFLAVIVSSILNVVMEFIPFTQHKKDHKKHVKKAIIVNSILILLTVAIIIEQVTGSAIIYQ